MLATNPVKMPKATHICHETARPPRMFAGAHSAAKTDTVLAVMPSPMPRAKRKARSCGQFWLNAEATLAKRHIKQPMKTAPRRPRRLLMGSESQAPLHGTHLAIRNILLPFRRNMKGLRRGRKTYTTPVLR